MAGLMLDAHQEWPCLHAYVNVLLHTGSSRNTAWPLMGSAALQANYLLGQALREKSDLPGGIKHLVKVIPFYVTKVPHHRKAGLSTNNQMLVLSLRGMRTLM